MTEKKAPTKAAMTPKDRDEQVRLTVGALVHYLRAQAAAGAQTTLDMDGLESRVPARWRGPLAVLRAMAAEGVSPSEQELGRRFYSRSAEILRAAGDASALGDQAPELLERLRALPEMDGNRGVLVRVTHNGREHSGPHKLRPVTRGGITLAPGTTLELRITNRAQWLQWKTNQDTDFEVLEGDPVGAGFVRPTL